MSRLREKTVAHMLLTCLFDLTCFFLPSFSSLIKTCILYKHVNNVHIISTCVYVLLQVDEDMTAKLDLSHTRFSFMENEKVFTPNWMAPEG